MYICVNLVCFIIVFLVILKIIFSNASRIGEKKCKAAGYKHVRIFLFFYLTLFYFLTVSQAEPVLPPSRIV